MRELKIEDLKGKFNIKVKAYFGERDRRTPIIGMFVNCIDSDYLSSKDMVRFVSLSNFDNWNPEYPSIGLTKIYKITDFTQIITV